MDKFEERLSIQEKVLSRAKEHYNYYNYKGVNYLVYDAFKDAIIIKAECCYEFRCWIRSIKADGRDIQLSECYFGGVIVINKC